MKRKAILAMVLAFVALGMVTGGAAQTWTDNDTSTSGDLNESDIAESPGTGGALADDQFNVDMAVTSLVQLDVKPEQINYPSVDVADRDINTERDFTSINLQNTGSEFIDQIWMESSLPDSDPFRTGESTGSSTDGGAHNAGNFVMVRPESSPDTNLNDSIYNTDSYHFINRKEWTYGGVDVSDNEIANPDQIPDFINYDLSDMSVVTDVGSGTLQNGQNPQDIFSDDANGVSQHSDFTNTQTAEEVQVGTMRVAGRDYYYALVSDTEGDIVGDTGNVNLRIADAGYADLVSSNSNISEPNPPAVAYHSSDTFGAYDFTNNGAPNEPVRYRVYDVEFRNGGGGDGVGVAEDVLLRANADNLEFDGEKTEDGVNNNGEDRRYDVVINQTSSGQATTTRTRFNPSTPEMRDFEANDLQSAGTTESVAQFMFDADTSADMLQPGQSLTVDTAMEVPRGVVQGQPSQGTLTVAFTSDNTVTPGQDAEEFISTDQ